MNRLLAVLLSISLLVCVTSRASAQEFAYQGRLSGSLANTTGTVPFKFAIVSSGATIWSHDGTSVNGSEPVSPFNVPVVQGVFSVMLGSAPMQPIRGPGVNALQSASLRTWVFIDNVWTAIPDQTLGSSPSALGVVQSATAHTNFLARWDGTKLSAGSVFESASGDVALGTTPVSGVKLTVAGSVQANGPIHSTNGGFRFPDGTVQTTASGTAIRTVNGASGPALTIQGGTNISISTSGNTILVSTSVAVCTYVGRTYTTGTVCTQGFWCHNCCQDCPGCEQFGGIPRGSKYRRFRCNSDGSWEDVNSQSGAPCSLNALSPNC